MSISLYYRASRAAAITPAETAAVERIVAAHRSSFPYEDEDGLHLYDTAGGEPEEVVAGSTRIPLDPARVLPVIAQVLSSVTELRRALPGADWHVHLDDLDLPWDEGEGYALPADPGGARPGG
ncbi:hypothetical protein [Kitasatospora sp. NPDC089509]|uniref:hypothetical protein n=1 Tax=Kitasatospora sp. NPDC089509 TaxID=3364079 RepID=UPI003817B429